MFISGLTYRFSCLILKGDDLRMTLDYEEDFQFFTRVFEHFYPETPQFTLADLIGWLRENPSPMDINKHKTVKFGKEDIDVSLKI